MARPIIFVAHGLGKVIVKSALVHSNSARPGALQDQKSIWLSTYGIISMGTPCLDGRDLHQEWFQQQTAQQYILIGGDFVTKDVLEETTFASKDDSGYRTISGHLQIMARDMGETIKV
jgi:hypothetical protein